MVPSYHRTDTTSSQLEGARLEPFSTRALAPSSSVSCLTNGSDIGSFNATSHNQFQYQLNDEAMTNSKASTFDSYHDSNLFLGEPTFNNQTDTLIPYQECPSLSGSTKTTDLLTFQSTPSDQILRIGHGNEEAMLLMHYLDEVFFVQFPFYNSSAASGGRGWLYSLLAQVKPLYDAVLALSQYHRESLRLTPRNNTNVNAHKLVHLQSRDDHYNAALRELQLSIGGSHMWSGTSILIRSIQALTCILQLLFFEVCHL